MLAVAHHLPQYGDTVLRPDRSCAAGRDGSPDRVKRVEEHEDRPVRSGMGMPHEFPLQEGEGAATKVEERLSLRYGTRDPSAGHLRGMLGQPAERHGARVSRFRRTRRGRLYPRRTSRSPWSERRGNRVPLSCSLIADQNQIGPGGFSSGAACRPPQSLRKTPDPAHPSRTSIPRTSAPAAAGA